MVQETGQIDWTGAPELDVELLDVNEYSRPGKWQAIIVIKVGQDNVDIKYQLFYSPQGMLLKTRNVSYMHDILGPGTFL